MARPQKYSDEDILKGARRVFTEKGMHASTQEVADAIGISQAALFKRFGTKEKLVIAALLPDALPNFLVKLQAGPDERPLMEQLHGLGCVMGKFFEQMIPTVAAMGSDLHSLLHAEDPPPPVRVMMALTSFLRTAHDDGRLRCESPKVCATLFLGSLYQRAFLLYIHPDMPLPPVEQHVADALSLLWTGIAPAETSPVVENLS
ncbi:MAG: TetR/AcrR family transcriptional regulator [Deltaproteobacteria bacterium]|nr:TetR/AcrR family transcriptional regulator [Deltaproteobacteria bacterium]